MQKIFFLILIFFYTNIFAYNEDEIICIENYDLATDFFLSMKDEKTSREMLLKKKELLNKYDEGHFPLEDIQFMKTEIHYAWSNNFDFLPPILENCVQNIH